MSSTIFISGKQYDISNFDHPGNEVIYEYEGRDATDVFNAFHPKSAYYALNKLPKLNGKLKVDDKFVENEFELDIRSLHYQLLKNGNYKANVSYYVFVLFRNLALLVAAFYVPHYISCCLLGLFMVQMGWLCHDILHNQLFKDRFHADTYGGLLLGCLCQGFSGSWWKVKHNTHHASPNVEDHDPDIDTAPLLAWSASLLKKSLASYPAFFKIWLKYQHLLFFPLLMIARTSWYLQSIMASVNKRQFPELFFLGLHWSLKIWFSLTHGGLAHFIVMEAIASFMLAIVFSLNHNPLPTIQMDAVKMGFYEHQVRASRNYSGGYLIDYISGGLSYQIEHHVFIS